MNLPKVIFTDIPISKEIDWFYGFLFQDNWNWGKYIIKKHPKIKKIFSFKNEADRNCMACLYSMNKIKEKLPNIMKP